MKRIVKSPSPKELTQWLRGQQKLAQEQKLAKGQTMNCRYKQLETRIKIIVKQRLLQDQGYLCCYTGIRISEKTSHIEHFKPQSEFYENHEDVDYNNLFAAFPGSDYGKDQDEEKQGKNQDEEKQDEKKRRSCPFGAHARTDWYDQEQFINPLSPQCETVFHFDLDGKISADPNNLAAQTTLDRLNLADPSLTDMRKDAIYEFLYESEISTKQAEVLLEKIIHNHDSKGRYRSFCFVLKQACEEYIRRRKQKQIKNKVIQSQTRKSKK